MSATATSIEPKFTITGREAGVAIDCVAPPERRIELAAELLAFIVDTERRRGFYPSMRMLQHAFAGRRDSEGWVLHEAGVRNLLAHLVYLEAVEVVVTYKETVRYRVARDLMDDLADG